MEDVHPLPAWRGAGLDGSRMWPNCGGVALVYYQPFLCLACMSELRRLARCEPRRMLIPIYTEVTFGTNNNDRKYYYNHWLLVSTMALSIENCIEFKTQYDYADNHIIINNQ